VGGEKLGLGQIRTISDEMGGERRWIANILLMCEKTKVAVGMSCNCYREWENKNVHKRALCSYKKSTREISFT
jgi:hypothetical protein